MRELEEGRRIYLQGVKFLLLRSKSSFNPLSLFNLLQKFLLPFLKVLLQSSLGSSL